MDKGEQLMNEKEEMAFYQKAEAIALNCRKFEVETIYTIADAIEKEFKQMFKKRFRKVQFLEKAGLV